MTPIHPIAALGRFVDVFIDDPTEAGFETALQAVPDAPSVLIAYLESRFVRLEPMLPIESDPSWWAVLELLPTRWTTGDRESFLTTVGLRAASPDTYRWLAPFFREGVPIDMLEPWLLNHLERGEDLERQNASHLAYHLFDGTPGYALSPAGKARLEAAEPT